jgi:gamma-glutamyltranspeptidase/glutathione hydrolase
MHTSRTQQPRTPCVAWPSQALARLLPLAAALLLVVALPARAAYLPSAEGAHVAVVTDNGEATQAALGTLAAGGNAVDAAITAALTMGVVNPVSSGLGGGGFALVYVAKDHRTVALDFRETSPVGLVADEIVQRAGARTGGAEDATKRGVAVGVPGEPAGLEWLSKTFGHRSLAEDAAPAVKIAKQGFLVSHYMADMVWRMRDRMGVSSELSTLLLPGGTAARFRAPMARPELAHTLERFGAEGAKIFYEGDIGAKIVRAVRAAGGQLGAADLAAYKPVERAPLSRTVDNRTIVTVPAPSAGGLMVLEVLSMFGANGASPLHAMGFGSSAYLHSLAEAMRGAVADRVRLAGDPDADTAVDAGLAHALEAKQIAARRARITLTRTHAAPEFRTREEGTTHIIVADADGNVVSLTSSINAPFGARIAAEDTGIVLNDELDDFSTPEDIAGFGVVGLGPNRPRPGVRPVSSMAPTLVLENGEPILAIGGSGGGRIATGVTQAALARLVFGLDPGACVSAPRIHVNGSSHELLVDPELTEDVRAGLRGHGETPKAESYLRSSMNMVAWDRSGPAVRLLAASDPRKGGMAAAQ